MSSRALAHVSGGKQLPRSVSPQTRLAPDSNSAGKKGRLVLSSRRVKSGAFAGEDSAAGPDPAWRQGSDRSGVDRVRLAQIAKRERPQPRHLTCFNGNLTLALQGFITISPIPTLTIAQCS